MQFCAWHSVMTPGNSFHLFMITEKKRKNNLTCGPPWDNSHRAVHRGHDLSANLAQLRIGQPSHPIHQRVQVLDHRPDRRHVGRHLERPRLPVLAALVQVLAVRPVARDHIQRLAHDEVLERGGVHPAVF